MRTLDLINYLTQRLSEDGNRHISEFIVRGDSTITIDYKDPVADDKYRYQVSRQYGEAYCYTDYNAWFIDSDSRTWTEIRTGGEMVMPATFCHMSREEAESTIRAWGYNAPLPPCDMLLI